MKDEYKRLKPYLQDLLRDIKSNKPKSKTQVFRECLSFPFARTKTELLKNKKKFVDLYPGMMSALINMVCDQQKYGKGSTYDTGYYIINSLPKNREYFAVTFTVREGNIEPSVVYEDGITQGGGHGFVITLQLACKEKKSVFKSRDTIPRRHEEFDNDDEYRFLSSEIKYEALVGANLDEVRIVGGLGEKLQRLQINLLAKKGKMIFGN